MFKIGEFSRLANTSVRMLRHYDKLGLLIPSQVNSESDYRYYQAAQLATVNKIKQLQELGFSLAIIKEMLAGNQGLPLEHYFELRQQEVAEELAKLKQQQQLVTSATQIIQQATSLSAYHVVEKIMPERYVMSLKQIIPTYNDEGQLWEQLGIEAKKQHVKFRTPPLGLTLYHGDEYQEHTIETEVQSSVCGSYQDTEVVTFKTVPEMRVASITFNGSYDQMPQVAEVAANWLELHNVQLAGPMFNIFHVSPTESRQPENWVTEACYQITERKADH